MQAGFPKSEPPVMPPVAMQTTVDAVGATHDKAKGISTFGFSDTGPFYGGFLLRRVQRLARLRDA
jgi:hypothetical protein